MTKQEINQLCDDIEQSVMPDEVTLEMIDTYLKQNKLELSFEDYSKVVEQFFMILDSSETTKIVSYVRCELSQMYSNLTFNRQQKEMITLFICNFLMREYDEEFAVVKQKSKYISLDKYVLDKLRES